MKHFPSVLKMMAMKKGMIFFLSATVLFLAACGSGDPKETKKDDQKKETAYEGEADFENRMSAIDNNDKLSIANSLDYRDNAGSTEAVTAYLDDQQNIVKLEEDFSDVKTSNFGTLIFYIENGKKFATKEVYQENRMAEPLFIERITYYDKSEKPVYAKVRTATYEMDLESQPFETTKAENVSVSRAMRVLNQEKEFETTFQGLASDGTLQYLVVGENTADGYAASLAVQHTEGDIKKLFNDEKGMIGTPLEIQFERMVDETGLEFQVLLSVKIKK
jgi:hypothetical protein